MRWLTTAAAPGAIFSITVFVVVIAAIRAKPDNRDYLLQILRTLVRWRER